MRKELPMVLTLIVLIEILSMNTAHADSSTDLISPTDFQAQPSSIRHVESAEGHYRLNITTTGKTAQAMLTDANNVVLWQDSLPQEMGPRQALLGRNGSAVLLDEWINIFTDYAIVVISPEGKELAVHSTDDIARFLGRKRSDLASQAKFGPWMQGLAKVSDSGDVVIIPMGKDIIVVSLKDGTLSFLP